MPSLDDILGGVRVVAPVPGEEAVEEAPPLDGASASDEESASADTGEDDGEQPWGVVEMTLPSGIEVYYQAGPKRLYRIRQLLQPKEEFFEWREVRSMSKVSDVLDKAGLVHWAEKIGINLVQELLRKEHVSLADVLKFVPNEEKDPPWYGGDHLQTIGKTKKLTNYYMKDAAASRGTSVHSALEGWAATGDLANPDDFPEEEQGYVLGLNKFLRESDFQPRMSEVIVASVNHEVAGRFDLLGDIPAPVKLVTHLTRGLENEQRELIEACSGIVDLKTSKGIYNDHHFQVAGYKGCLVESGYTEPDKGFVLRTTRKGNYEVKEITADWIDFWFLLGLNESIDLMEQRQRERNAARKGKK